MEHNQAILEFAKVDPAEYLNRAHPTEEVAIIQQEKHTLLQYKDEIHSHLRLSFTENCDALIEILQSYTFCHALINKCNPPIEEPPAEAAEQPAQEYVSPADSAELARAYSQFEDDMSVFKAGHRYLVAAETVGDLLVLLTNDLLILGRRVSGSRKHKLEHAYPRHAIVLEREGSRVAVATAASGVRYELEGEGAVELYEAYKAGGVMGGNGNSDSIMRNGNSDSVMGSVNTAHGTEGYGSGMSNTSRNDIIGTESDVNGSNDVTNKHHRAVEYFIMTEQLKELVDYLRTTRRPVPSVPSVSSPDHRPTVGMEPFTYLPGEYDISIFKQFQFASASELKMAMDLCSGPLILLDEHVLSRFMHGLRRINRLERTPVLVGSVFDYVEEFVEEVEQFTRENGVAATHFLLLVEKLILTVFLFLERRIFNKFYELDENSECIETIRKRLLFRSGLDYRYLVKRLLEKREEFERACLENAKLKIVERVEKIFGCE